jgi:hypothetical protein
VPSPTEVANFQRLITTLSAQSAIAVTNLWNQYQNADPETRWQELQEAFPLVVDPFLASAAVLSTEWYRSLDPESTFPAEPAPGPAFAALAANATWALTQFNPLENMLGSVDREVFSASRETLVSNAEREGVRFARYASANACAWCRVLATREPVYKSAANAVKGHDNCHCMAVPVRGGDTYTPPAYVADWLEEYNTARRQAGGNLDDIVNQMRKTRYPGEKDLLNAERRARYAAKKAAQNVTPTPSG